MVDKKTLIQENPFKALLLLAVPIIVLLFFNETYITLDTFFLSKLGNDVIIAFGYISNIYYFINRLGKGVGRGVSSIIARLIGAKNYDDINNIALHGLLIIIIVSIASLIIFGLLADWLIHLVVPDHQFSYVFIYMECMIFFIIFICLSEYLVELLNGEGDTRLSTIIMTFGIFLNAILDYIFIFPFKLGILGASLGTSVSYVITTLIFAYIYLVRKNHIVKFTFSEFNFDSTILREILINTVPIILDSLVITLSGLFLMVELKNYAPAVTIVAFVILLRIQNFLFTPNSSLSRSCNIVVGHLFGAKRFEDVKSIFHKSIIVSFLINGLIALILIQFLNVILGFFTNQLNVMVEVRNISCIVIADLIIFSVIFNSNQALIAIGHSTKSFSSVIVRFVSLFAFVFMLCHMLQFGKFGVLISLLLSDLVQAAYSYITFRYHILKVKNNHDDVLKENTPS